MRSRRKSTFQQKTDDTSPYAADEKPCDPGQDFLDIAHRVFEAGETGIDTGLMGAAHKSTKSERVEGLQADDAL